MDRIEQQNKTEWISKESTGLLLLLLSAMLYSVMGCFLKLASESGIPSTELVFLRVIFQGSFVIVGMIFMKEHGEKDSIDPNSRDNTVTEEESQKNEEPALLQNSRLIFVPLGRTKHVIQVVVARGAFGGFGFVCYFFTIKSIPLGDAITLLSLTPIVTIFLARLVLKEQIRCIHIIATIGSTAGAILIAGPSRLSTLLKIHDGADEIDLMTANGQYYNPLGYVTAILGTFCGSSVLVLVRKAGKLGVHTLQLIFSWCIFGLGFSSMVGLSISKSASLQLLSHEEPWHMPSTSIVWWFILGMCVSGSFAHFLMNYAARFAPAGLSAIIRSSGIMWAYLYEVLVFHQIPNRMTSCGVMLIFASILLIAWGKYQDQKAKNSRNTKEEEEALLMKNNDGEMIIGLKSESYGSFPSAPSLAVV